MKNCLIVSRAYIRLLIHDLTPTYINGIVKTYELKTPRGHVIFAPTKKELLKNCYEALYNGMFNKD